MAPGILVDRTFNIFCRKEPDFFPLCILKCCISCNVYNFHVKSIWNGSHGRGSLTSSNFRRHLKKNHTFRGLEIYESKRVHFPHLYCMCISLKWTESRKKKNVLQYPHLLHTNIDPKTPFVIMHVYMTIEINMERFPLFVSDIVVFFQSLHWTIYVSYTVQSNALFIQNRN